MTGTAAEPPEPRMKNERGLDRSIVEEVKRDVDIGLSRSSGAVPNEREGRRREERRAREREAKDLSYFRKLPRRNRASPFSTLSFLVEVTSSLVMPDLGRRIDGNREKLQAGRLWGKGKRFRAECLIEMIFF